MSESSSNPVPMLTFVHASIQLFSQAKLHWLSKAFHLRKNIRFDLSIAQWQLITAQNRDFSLFFFKHNKKSTLLQDVCCHWSSPLPKPTEMKCFFPKRLQHLLKSLYRVQEPLNQHLSQCPCFHQIQQLIQSLFPVYLNAVIYIYI